MFDEAERSPRERRHQRTHDAILDAARAILHEQGAHKLSMRAIADRIDYSPAGLYEYFGSKDEIIAAVCRQGHRKLKVDQAAVEPSRPIADYIVELGMTYIRFATRNPDYFLLMFTGGGAQTEAGDEDAQTPEEQRAEMVGEDSSFPILLAAVQRGIDEGAIRTAPGFGRMEIAYALWSIVHGMAMLRIGHLQDSPFDFDAINRQALRAFILGLGG